MYPTHGLELSSRCFAVLFLVRDEGPLGVTELAPRLGQTHPAVSQLSRTLLEHGVITERRDAGDERRRLLAPSPKGTALMIRMLTLWRAITAAVDELCDEAKVDFLPALTSFESALNARQFSERISPACRSRPAGRW